MYKVQHLHVKDYSVTVIVVFFFLKKCKLDAGGTDEDYVLDDPVSKKKGSSSNSNQNSGKRSRKVMTEVNIARYQFNLSIFSCLSDTCSCPIVIYSAQMPIRPSQNSIVYLAVVTYLC
jgi:hypothetical protein